MISVLLGGGFIFLNINTHKLKRFLHCGSPYIKSLKELLICELIHNSPLKDNPLHEFPLKTYFI